MARPNNSLFNNDEKRIEATLISIINKARQTNESSIIDRALEELSNLYRLVEMRNGS